MLEPNFEEADGLGIDFVRFLEEFEDLYCLLLKDGRKYLDRYLAA